MRIPESTLSEIQNRLDIAEVIGEYVTLQRKGARYWGLCPFHQEKSPSFSVTPEKGVFYCFGCHKGGGLFQFVMEAEKVPWRDAVELLAKKAGIEIPRGDEGEGGVKREAFLELNKRVAGSFNWLLLEGTAGRGRAEIPRVERRHAGDHRQVPDRLCAAGQGVAAPVSHAEELLGGFSRPDGACSRRQGEGGTTTMFANRIMFPIVEPAG